MENNFNISAYKISEGEFFEISSESDFLVFFFSKRLNRFLIEFNAKIVHSSTSFDNSIKKINELSKQYNLIHIKD